MNESLTPSLASFSDPSDRERRRAVLTAATLCDRMEGSREDLEAVLAMLGLTESAWEILHRPKPAAPPVAGKRDNIGRLRSAAPSTTQVHQTDPENVVAATLDPIPAPPRMCRTGEHRMTPENTNTRNRCRACENRRRRGGAPVAVKDPDAPALCRCPGEKHVVVVTKGGRRHCRIATLKRQSERRAKAKAAPKHNGHWVETGETA